MNDRLEVSPEVRPNVSALVGPTALAAIWLIANTAWVHHYRAAQLWDHEEVGYVDNATRMARAAGVSELWFEVSTGHVGPAQALLALPSQRLFGIDGATVVWINLVAVALAGVAIGVLVHVLAGRAAALAACTLTLVVPGMLENARGALTMTPATAAAAATVAVLAIGRGLSSRRWAAVAGALMAAMALSRPMALVLIPALAYLAWAWTPDRGDRAARRPLLANAAVAAGSFGLLAGWWFVTAEEDLTQYLQEGAPGVDRGNLIAVFLDRIHEVFLYLGPINGMLFPGLLPAVAGFAYLGLRRFGQDPDPTASDGRLPLGPLWVAVGIAVVTTLVSNTMGWLMLPVVPWIVAATVAGARRGLSERSWRWWASIVVAIPLAGALATSLVDPVPGNRFTWCLHPFDQPSTCSIGHEDAEAHKAALVALADGNRAIFDGVSTMIEAPDTAMVSRDHALSPLAITGQSYLTDDWRQPGPLAFPLGAPEADQREVIIDQAEIVLVVPDPDAGSLLTDAMLDPDGLPDALRAAGFASCRSVVLPDDRVAEILVRASLRGTWCEGA